LECLKNKIKKKTFAYHWSQEKTDLRLWIESGTERGKNLLLWKWKDENKKGPVITAYVFLCKTYATYTWKNTPGYTLCYESKRGLQSSHAQQYGYIA